MSYDPHAPRHGSAGRHRPVSTSGDRRPVRAAGVVGAWLTGWADAADTVDGEQAGCLVGLDVAGNDRVELSRRWLVVDWLVRAVAPRWLRAVGLDDHAVALRHLGPLGSPEALAAAGPAVEAAAHSAGRVHQATWADLLDKAQRQVDPGQSELWLALRDGAQTATGATRLVLEPASRATGYPTSGRGPSVWRHTVTVISDSAGALAWNATAAMTDWAAWSWHLPPVTARALAYAAARAALAPTEAATHGAAAELLAAMFTIGTNQNGQPR